MRHIAIGTSLCAGLLVFSLHAEDLPADPQADHVHQAFENARQAQLAKPSKLEYAAGLVAGGFLDNEKYWDPRYRDGNPADRRGPINRKPVQNAEDAVTRPAPQ